MIAVLFDSDQWSMAGPNHFWLSFSRGERTYWLFWTKSENFRVLDFRMVSLMLMDS
jgi:hypothetical protein